MMGWGRREGETQVEGEGRTNGWREESLEEEEEGVRPKWRVGGRDLQGGRRRDPQGGTAPGE